MRENRLRGGIIFFFKKKRFKNGERIHAWISNFTAEHLEEIARLEKRGLLFFSDNLRAVMLPLHTWKEGRRARMGG